LVKRSPLRAYLTRAPAPAAGRRLLGWQERRQQPLRPPAVGPELPAWCAPQLPRPQPPEHPAHPAGRWLPPPLPQPLPPLTPAEQALHPPALLHRCSCQPPAQQPGQGLRPAQLQRQLAPPPGREAWVQCWQASQTARWPVPQHCAAQTTGSGRPAGWQGLRAALLLLPGQQAQACAAAAAAAPLGATLAAAAAAPLGATLAAAAAGMGAAVVAAAERGRLALFLQPAPAPQTAGCRAPVLPCGQAAAAGRVVAPDRVAVPATAAHLPHPPGAMLGNGRIWGMVLHWQLKLNGQRGSRTGKRNANGAG
jgi:hypothetical protein